MVMSSLIMGLSISPLVCEVVYYDPDGNPLPFADPAEVVEFLQEATLERKEFKSIQEGTNKAKKRGIISRNGVRARVIHRTGYEIKQDAPGGGFVDSYLSEIAAFEMDRLLGLGRVPPTIRRKGGSLQIWIEGPVTDAMRRKEGREPSDPDRFEKQLQIMRIFDNLIANTDRNPGNILIDGNDRIWFVDHTRSFSGLKELKYPDQITGCERRLWERLQSVTDNEIRKHVGPYAKFYVSALLERRRLLVAEIRRRIQSEGESFLFTLED